MLRIENLTYRVGARLLLDQASAVINAGHRVGLVGRNGTGKTTLLKLIVGELEPDGGRIILPAGVRVGMSRQEAPGGGQSVLDTVLAGDTELSRLTAEAETTTDAHRLAEIHERLNQRAAHAAPARAARILAGLGFAEEAQARPCATFAGGWRMRVALAALLFAEPDLLLLDEPTNHLDLEASLWLEDYLRGYPGTVLLVSHDRGLLNRVVEEILHLDRASLTLYTGGYDRFEDTRRAQAELNDKLRAKQQTQRAHLQAFVDRFRYKASKARQAQSRLKMLARLQPIPEDRDEAPVHFAFPDPDPLPPPLLTLENVKLGYDGRAVLGNLNLRLDSDDRVALLGANGNGKSTLIKLLAGRLAPLAGEVIKSGKLKVGYFAQHQAEELDLDATPLIELGRRRRHDSEQHLRSHLGRFGFGQQRAETKIAVLSGGEKARLLFALMTSHRPHLLLLDEPTNHLDVASRQALIEALAEFSGAVVIVSHDHHVLELVADRLWLVADGNVSAFDGDIEDYRAWLLTQGRASAAGRTADGEPAAASRKRQRQQAAERQAAMAPLKKQLAATEREVARLTAERTKLAAAMADPRLYAGDGARVVSLSRELDAVEKALGAAEAAWFTLHEALEQAEATP
jgi:ATP-binding cassette subfamily F protein 3